MEESDSARCGVCFSLQGKATRGEIDSCDHYFCFVCIMEWSKIESKCPICKQRFSAIRRPPRIGLFASERRITVPLRDQVYHPHGNISSGPSDPNSQLQCSVCHGMDEESLLLLCDLCDSAAHIHCIGLGTAVLEDDWFCYECAMCRDEHAKSEIVDDCDNNLVQSADKDLSVFNNVQEVAHNSPEVERGHVAD